MLRAALAVIAERGYPETRIADVAERAGTSPALVIHYFKTGASCSPSPSVSPRTPGTPKARGGWRRSRAQPGDWRRSSPCPACRRRTLGPRVLAAVAGPVGAGGPRHPEVASVREKFDERWRESIRSVVLAGQDAGEFRAVDGDDFAVLLSALLDGLAVQIGQPR